MYIHELIIGGARWGSRAHVCRNGQHSSLVLSVLIKSCCSCSFLCFQRNVTSANQRVSYIYAVINFKKQQSADDYVHHLQMLQCLCCAKSHASCQEVQTEAADHDTRSPVSTEHCVLLPEEANVLFGSMALSFSSVSKHTHVLGLLLCNARSLIFGDGLRQF